MFLCVCVFVCIYIFRCRVVLCGRHFPFDFRPPFIHYNTLLCARSRPISPSHTNRRHLPPKRYAPCPPQIDDTLSTRIEVSKSLPLLPSSPPAKMSGFAGGSPAPCSDAGCCPPKPVAIINQRVRDGDGFYATVLYVGPVASAKNQKETYVGVEWDDDTRGKHDGSVISRATNAIVRHFKCESAAPTAGSFVKPSKVRLRAMRSAPTLSICYVAATNSQLLAPDRLRRGLRDHPVQPVRRPRRAASGS